MSHKRKVIPKAARNFENSLIAEIRRIEQPFLDFLQRRVVHDNGWHICTIACHALTLIFQQTLSLRSKTRPGPGNGIRVEIGIYNPHDPLAVEPQTYVLVRYGGDVYFIDPTYEQLFKHKHRRSILLRKYSRLQLRKQNLSRRLKHDFHIEPYRASHRRLLANSPSLHMQSEKERQRWYTFTLRWLNNADFAEIIQDRETGKLIGVTAFEEIKQLVMQTTGKDLLKEIIIV